MQELLNLEEAAHVYLEDASEENEKKMKIAQKTAGSMTCCL